MTTALSVNVNKVALLRNSRDLDVPNVLRAAQICVAAGADGITVHPRPDERHIRRADVLELAGALEVELNIEGNPFPELLELMRKVAPAQCTLVPDSPEQKTSDHGWTLREGGRPSDDAARLGPIVAELRARGSRVSLFMDPAPEQIAAACDVGADRVELYTEPYARAFGTPRESETLERYAAAARAAREAGLGVNAGHDLNLDNLGRFCAAVPGVLEVSIGHALIADALLERGLAGTVRAYRRVLSEAAA